MTKLNWNEPGSRHFETGVDRGVLYLDDDPGISWNGLISVNDTPTDASVIPSYIDGQKYNEFVGGNSFSCFARAFTYPEEFDNYIGFSDSSGAIISSQPVKPFGMSYRTQIGNDIDGTDFAYKIHLVYNASANIVVENRTSISTAINPMIFGLDISTLPVPIEGYRPSSHIIIDSRYTYSWALSKFEDIIYGTETEDPRLPLPNEIFDLFENESILKITDNGDGTWTAETRPGFDHIIQTIDPTIFQIDWPSAVYIDSDSFQIRSL